MTQQQTTSTADHHNTTAPRHTHTHTHAGIHALAKVPLTTEGAASSRFFIIYPLPFLCGASRGLVSSGGHGPPLLGSGGQSGECSVCADSRHSARRLIRRVVQSVSVTLSTRAPASLSRLAASIGGNTAPPEVALSKVKEHKCVAVVL